MKALLKTPNTAFCAEHILVRSVMTRTSELSPLYYWHST
jgi:hypothetical protein